ncbi:hypothetical protein [Sporomusa aerivorans]|uniref:hypothetical protein n=1 Tax=Sporomusa aerivorans TaxID=204936 RepID=UPI00352BC5F2
MDRTFTLYLDQLKKVIEEVEKNTQKTPLAANAVTLVVSDNDACLRLFQKVGHDWIYLSDAQFCEFK